MLFRVHWKKTRINFKMYGDIKEGRWRTLPIAWQEQWLDCICSLVGKTKTGLWWLLCVLLGFVFVCLLVFPLLPKEALEDGLSCSHFSSSRTEMLWCLVFLQCCDGRRLDCHKWSHTSVIPHVASLLAIRMVLSP